MTENVWVALIICSMIVAVTFIITLGCLIYPIVEEFVRQWKYERQTKEP